MQHRGVCKRHIVLEISVKDVWELFEAYKLTNIFHFWLRVLSLSKKDEGGNGRMEQERGLTTVLE